MSEDLLLRFLNSSIVSEYDDEPIWTEVAKMNSDGLIDVKGVITGTIAVALTEKGRALALETLKALPRVNYPKTPADAPRIGSLAVDHHGHVYSYAGWVDERELSAEVKGTPPTPTATPPSG